MPLAPTPQETFARGMIRDVARHLIPNDGCWDIVNGLLDDNGSIYRRAGSQYKGTALSGGVRIRLVWDGYLLGGARTFIASDSGFAVLGADDATPVSLGGGGLTAPGRAKEHRGVLYLPGGTTYAGSRKSADYSTGTVATTNNSQTVTGTGTLWAANADAGMFMRVAAGQYYAVQSVDGDGQVTLKEPYQGITATGQAYTLTRLGVAAKVGTFYESVANRLLVSTGSNLLSFSGIANPLSFATNDFHEIPGGINILGLSRARDQAIVYTTGGVWTIAQMAYNLVDANGNIQQRLAQLNADSILWGDAGVAEWEGQVVVPTLHGVFFLSPNGAMDGVSSSYTGSVNNLILSYIQAGYRPGQATVYEGHYFLPILDATANTVIDFMVARLDRPVFSWHGRHVFKTYPWSHFTGHGGNVLCAATRSLVGARPHLLAGSAAAARLLTLDPTEPGAATKNDADSTTPQFLVETRDFPTGQNNANLVRRMRSRYEMVDAAADHPTIQAYVSRGSQDLTSVAKWDQVTWDNFAWAADTAGSLYTLLMNSAPVDDGRQPFTWDVETRARYIRFRLQSSQPVAKLTVRDVILYTRPSKKQT